MTKKEIKTIGVLTSGGDGPGMNSCIRAVVRTAIGNGLKVFAIHRGYAGLIEGDMRQMDASSVGNILQRGGTVIKTSRCPEFHEASVRKEAANILRRKGIDGLITIGGDGTFNGAHLFFEENHFPVVGIPGTIDNDISNTEYTIGFDTAVQTSIEAVDRIRDTASSHDRIFLVEVMGRNSPAIALKVGVCTGAENILFPNTEIDYQAIVNDIKRGIARGKSSSIIVVAEGKVAGRTYAIRDKLKNDFGMEAHVCILGHIQRGGSPSASDRFISAEMGHEAVKALMAGNFPTATAYKSGKVVLVPLKDCLSKTSSVDTSYQDLAKVLSI